MSKDIFQRQTDSFGGAFAADKAKITFPTVAALTTKAGVTTNFGLLIQRLQMTYQQQVTRLYEVGHPAVYYVGGRTQGDTTMDRVVGPRSIAVKWYETFGDVCNALSNTLQFQLQGGCGDAGIVDHDTGKITKKPGLAFTTKKYMSYFNVITSVGIGVQAQDMVINENVRMMFSSFDYG